MRLRSILLIAVLCVCGCDTGNAPGNSTANPGSPAADLVGWWKFDAGSGDTAQDSSRFGHSARILNGRWVPGKEGSALEMSGTVSPLAADDGIVTVPLSDALRGTADEITIMAWTYRTAMHNGAILAHRYPALFFGFHGAQFKWQFQGDRTSHLLSVAANVVRIPDRNETLVLGRYGASCYADPEHVAELNRWIHVAATFDGRTARLYADGVEICARNFRGAMRMPEAPFTMSGYLDKSNQIIDEISGMLDDVRIYRRALSATEIDTVVHGVSTGRQP